MNRVHEITIYGEACTVGTLIVLKHPYWSPGWPEEVRAIFKWMDITDTGEKTIYVSYISAGVPGRISLTEKELIERFVRIECPTEEEKRLCDNVVREIKGTGRPAKTYYWENDYSNIILCAMGLLLLIVFLPIVGIPLMLWIICKERS